jgi:hypothetical protein
MLAGGRYLSGDEPIRVFATGTAAVVTVRVDWRSGGQTVVAGVPVNHLVEVDEPSR